MNTTITKKHLTLPRRKADSVKGDNGRVLLIGGSPEFTGAPALASIAALRSGADSVVLAAPKKVAWAVNALSPDFVTKKLPGKNLSLRHYSTLMRAAREAHVVVMGMGVYERPSTMALLRKLASTIRAPKVLDAAALFAFDPRQLTNAVLLPNPKEYERLSRFIDPLKLVPRGNVLVRKGPRARIYSSDRIYENRTGNPSLTKAGTGDVLAGLVGGFIAQGNTPLQAAVNAVYTLGKLADHLFEERKWYSYLASDLAVEIRSFRHLL
ncbi:MAG: NAD(P)H-hydrate dehydratase [Candidatus Kerfeldbacteria bacterium]|nr:NAD(P)H-hydrate dehydratase [Candidatus Kerfeldbacteria bacterium]